MQLLVEVPGDVLTSPHLDDPTLDLSRWDGVGVPAGLVLRWLDDVPLTDGTIALLAQIPADELAPSDLPLLVKAWDRVESHAAARKAAAVAQLTDATRDFRGWDDDDPAPNEVSLACRIPLGAAQHEMHRAQRLRAVLPGTPGAVRGRADHRPPRRQDGRRDHDPDCGAVRAGGGARAARR